LEVVIDKKKRGIRIKDCSIIENSLI